MPSQPRRMSGLPGAVRSRRSSFTPAGARNASRTRRWRSVFARRAERSAPVPWRHTPGRCVAACALALLAAAHGARAQEPAAPASPAAPPPSALARWFNPATAPFIPIPDFDTEPHNGLTLGVIPTWLHTNSRDEIERITAPDIIHSQYFGWGAHMRVLGYPSADTQWSVVGGLKQRVEREFDGRYLTGQTRSGAVSWSVEAIYDRSGTHRFFGFGNQSVRSNETSFVNNQ